MTVQRTRDERAAAMGQAAAGRRHQRVPAPHVTHARRRGGQWGQSLVEFALVVPVMLILVFGILEFGFAIMDQVSVTNAAREGARAGTLKGGSASAAIAQAQRSASGLISCPLQTPTATYSGGNQNEITMTVQCAYAPVTPLGDLVKLFGASLNTALTLKGQVVMRVEQ